MKNSKYQKVNLDSRQFEWERLKSFTKEYCSFIDSDLQNYKKYLQQGERIFISK